MKSGKCPQCGSENVIKGSLTTPDGRTFIPGRVMRDLSAFARKHGIRQVILFGSRARGTHTGRSDIDLAVSGGDFDGFYWDTKEHTHSLLSFDIVELDGGISEELRAEIEQDGVVIYEEAG